MENAAIHGYPPEPVGCYRQVMNGVDASPLPPCIAPPPDLSDRATEVLSVFHHCDSQVISSFGGVYGLNWDRVERTAEKAGIDFSLEWQTLFKALESEWRKHANRPPEKSET